MQATMSDTTPWYRQLWPWLLISLPASAVIAGFITLALAIRTDDSLVVDDYYKEGKAINREIARDSRAAELGLVAELSAAPDGLRLRFTARTLPELAERMSVRFVHNTRAPLDREIAFTRLGRTEFVAVGEKLPADGHWTVHIESPDRQWRLVARLNGGPSTLRIEARP